MQGVDRNGARTEGNTALLYNNIRSHISYYFSILLTLIIFNHFARENQFCQNLNLYPLEAMQYKFLENQISIRKHKCISGSRFCRLGSWIKHCNAYFSETLKTCTEKLLFCFLQSWIKVWDILIVKTCKLFSPPDFILTTIHWR